MKFNICLGNLFRVQDEWGANHAVLLTAGDLVKLLRLALEQAGHSVMVSRTYLAKDRINIFMAAFHAEKRGIARKLKDSGYRFGFVEAEWLKDGLYNPFEQPSANARQFYDEFRESAEAADFVWYLVEESAEACLAANKNSHLWKIGHVPGFADLQPPADRTYVWDCSFAGYTSDYRQSVMDKIMARGMTIAASILEPDFMRASVLESAKVTLSISKSIAHPFISLTRVPHAIMNRVPVIAEYGGRPHYLSPYCVTAAPDTFVAACADFAARNDLLEYARDAHDRYAKELPMLPIIRKIVADTFG